MWKVNLYTVVNKRWAPELLICLYLVGGFEMLQGGIVHRELLDDELQATVS